MKAVEINQQILDLCNQVTGKRPRAVIDYIIKQGFVTTEELQEIGYDHPPRAARDVRENGVPLETFKVVSVRTGRKIGAYRFGDPANIKRGRIGGRQAFSKKFRDALIARYNSSDAITGEKMDARYLQIDHRIPYEVGGDASLASADLAEFMLLDASNQRAKSWSCESCENWQKILDSAICRTCFWAFPENYSHIAMQHSRRVDIVWKGDQVSDFESLEILASQQGKSVAEFVKSVVAKLSQ